VRTTMVFFVAFTISFVPSAYFGQSGGTPGSTEDKVSLSSSTDAADPSVPGAPAAKPSKRPSGVGIGIRVSTLGIGAEAAVAVTHRTNVRAGFNAFAFSRGYDNNGVHYAGDLKWLSGEAHFDWFPFAGNLHLSPGLIAYNDNHVNATATAPGGTSFKLSGTSYESDPADPVTGTAKLDFNKVAPTLLLGFGNLVPRRGRHFSVNIEAGVAFQGSPIIALSLAGSVCNPSGTSCRTIASDPTVQSNIQGQQTKISNDLSPFKYYPLLSLTVGYRF